MNILSQFMFNLVESYSLKRIMGWDAKKKKPQSEWNIFRGKMDYTKNGLWVWQIMANIKWQFTSFLIFCILKCIYWSKLILLISDAVWYYSLLKLNWIRIPKQEYICKNLLLHYENVFCFWFLMFEKILPAPENATTQTKK